MSHILNYQRRISAENEYPKIKKIKTFKKQNRKRSSQNLKRKEVKSHRESSLNNVELGLQNFLSKALLNNSNDTKYFNVNEEIEEIEKIKKNKKNKKKEDEYYHNKNYEFKRLLTLTNENKTDDILPSNQIGLGLFKKAQSNKKMNYKFKSITEKKNSLNNYIPQNSDSSIYNFLSSTEKFNTQKNNESPSPIDKQFVEQLRKNDFEKPKSKQNKIPKSLQNNINLLRNNIKSQFEKKLKINDILNNNSNSYINDNNNELKNNTQIKSNEKNINFSRKNNRERSQVVNKWLIYSKLISSAEPNNDDIKINDKGKKLSNVHKKKNYKTISPIHANDMKILLKMNNKTNISNTSSINPIENSSTPKNSIIEISKNFSRKKYKKFTQYCNKIKDKLIIQPKKSKTNLLEEEERIDSLLNLKTLTDNVLNPKYKTMTTNINLSLIEKKIIFKKKNKNHLK